jgi:hypothetical protein
MALPTYRPHDPALYLRRDQDWGRPMNNPHLRWRVPRLRELAAGLSKEVTT